MSTHKRIVVRSIIVLLILVVGSAFYLTRMLVAPWERYGIELIAIPAGYFEMGADDSDNPRHTVYLDSYSISKNLVTVKQYNTFCAATGHKRPELGRMNTNYWDAVDPNGFWRRLPPQLQPYFDPNWHRKHDPAEYPVVNVSWDDANAYCQWLSQETGRKFTLPTEAQWEKAARGTDGREYPWGEEWDADKCANSDSNNTKGRMPVGSYPSGQSPYGVWDMSGNVWQWCADWYDPDYPNAPNLRNPTGPATGDYRVIRGGSWANGDLDVGYRFRCAYRNSERPDSRYENFGFRVCCVSSGDGDKMAPAGGDKMTPAGGIVAAGGIGANEELLMGGRGSIRDVVEDALNADKRTKGKSITVSVHSDGKVELKGEVEDNTVKRAAGDVATKAFSSHGARPINRLTVTKH